MLLRYRAPVHDPAYRRLFSHPRMVADLLRGFVPGRWRDALDFSTLDKLPTDYVSDNLRARRSDLVWRVRFHDRRGSVLVPLEFQSTVALHMAVRILAYTALAYQDLMRREQWEPPGELPPVLPIVLYNGRRPWTAPLDVAELVGSGTAELTPYRPSQRYFVLDARRCGAHDLPPRNLVSALIAMETSDSREELAGAIDLALEWLPGAGEDELRRAFGVWVRQVLVPARFPGLAGGQELNLREVRTMLAETVQEWTRQWREEGRAEGREEGIEVGIQRVRAEERVLLGRLAARKFGARAGERLLGLLQNVTDPDRLAEIGEWIIECDSDTELFARVAPDSRRE